LGALRYYASGTAPLEFTEVWTVARHAVFRPFFSYRFFFVGRYLNGLRSAASDRYEHCKTKKKQKKNGVINRTGSICRAPRQDSREQLTFLIRIPTVDRLTPLTAINIYYMILLYIIILKPHRYCYCFCCYCYCY
jgi:hypothetical protein